MKTHLATLLPRWLKNGRACSAWLGLAALALAALAPQSAPAQPESFSPDNSLPPPAGVYVSPQLWHVAFSNGIVIRDISHERFLDKMPAPPLGTTQTHSFGSTVRFEVSTDGGATFAPGSGSANVNVRVRHTTDVAGRSIFDTEMTQLDLTAGGFKLRESPTLPSRGKTSIRPVAGGFMIASFFDIFTELSTDGGVSWLPAVQAGHVELRRDPNSAGTISTPSDLLPPPNDVYVSPADWHAAYAAGIVIKDVRHKHFVGSHPPPSAGSLTEDFGSQLDLQLSTDGGNTFRSVRAPAAVRVQVTRRSTGGLFDTEMLSLNFELPGAAGVPIMVRESPTEPSRGQTQITPQADGTFRIGSFFDIFTEISLDGGATWSPATTGPVRVNLEPGAPEQPAPDPDLPPPSGEYISPDRWHALYASGIIISNVSHSRFQPSTPPPPPGGTQEHTFNSAVSMDVLQPGMPPQHVVAPAIVTVRVTSTMDSGGTRYFETEMLQLDIQGGGLPPAMRVRESPTKASLGRTSIRKEPAGGQFMIGSFFDIFTELSLDGGQTWSPVVGGPATVRLRTPVTTPINISCPVNLTVAATGAAGAVVDYAVAAGGGCGGPVTIICMPASGSLFPVGTTVVTCVATDPCGNSATCTFQVTVNPTASVAPEIFFNNPLLPPREGVYVSPAQWHMLFANGIVIRDVRHRRFTQGFTAPPLGATTVHTFGSQVDFEFSTGGPAGPFEPGSASANVTVRVTHARDVGGRSFFDTEMLALDLVGGPLRLRESPTLPSRGQTTMRMVPGGQMISSFFDIWTELSVDGGQTWMPAQGSGHVELRSDIVAVEPVSAPTAVLPPPTHRFTSVQGPYQLMNVVMRNINNKLFSASQLPPPPGTPQTQNFNSQVDLELSTDGGATFQAVRVPAVQQVRVASLGAGGEQLYDTEMLSLNLSGGGLPAGMRFRESPTEPSRGMTQLGLMADGSVRMSSFFDIFVEMSSDNGATWQPLSTGPVRMELQPQAPEQPENSPNLPPLEDEYISPDRWHALYANGIIISNVSHLRFTQTQPPPPPGGSQTHSFGSMVEMDVILGPGQPPMRAQAPAAVNVMVASRQDIGDTRYFDTEMLALSIQGGGLPPNIMVRESPTRASLGRTSIRQVGTGFHIGSFFDIFTEISLNGGQSWSPMVSAPGTVSLHRPVDPPVSIICPPDQIVTATSAAGAVVNFVTLASGGCDPTPAITCTPPSGSVFPVGTTTVTCVAKDSCGNSARCTFMVTVRRYVKPRLFTTDLLPPPTGQYVSPERWHALYANGIIISNAVHNRFTASVPPPPPGVPQTHVFGSQVKFEISNDGGKVFHPMVATADVQVMLVNVGDPTGDAQVYRTEMLGLNMFAGPSGGVMIRESPTRASTGEVRIMPAQGGFMISSFFDIWTEISLDGGQSWSPSEMPAELELQVDPGSSPPPVTNVRMVNGRPTFMVPTQVGLTYLTEFTESLTNPLWRTVSGALGTGGPTTQTDYQSGGSTQRYYRTRVEESLTE